MKFFSARPAKHLRQLQVDRLEDLRQILNSDVNFVTCRRDEDPEIGLAAHQLIESGFNGVDEETNLEKLSFAVISHLRGCNCDPGYKMKFIQDVVNVSQVFFEITGAEKIRLVLKIVSDDACRKFHTDGYDLRLLCTYRGPGTEWIEDRYVNRDRLIHGSNEQIVRDLSKVQRTEAFEVSVLKGEHSKSMQRAGIVHRSPPLEGLTDVRRLLLRLDF